MTFFDFIVLAMVGASVVAGALRGLVRALLTGVALLAGLFVAAQGYETAGALLRQLGAVDSGAAANAYGFLLIVGVALLCGFIAGRFVKGGLRRARLSWLDGTLGASFGLVRGLAVCSILYLALTAFPVRLDAVAEARSAPILAEGARLLVNFTSSDIRARFFDEHRG
ncbi:MAG TPA: CvpA family protein [Pyrinomonadaceae bacterium]|jgi:membrane protein required for colicin V production|nr:CvpA family protein [Pyrinomonadaceae bacterium]